MKLSKLKFSIIKLSLFNTNKLSFLISISKFISKLFSPEFIISRLLFNSSYVKYCLI